MSRLPESEKQLGAILRRQRKQANMTQTELGEKIPSAPGDNFQAGGWCTGHAAPHSDGGSVDA